MKSLITSLLLTCTALAVDVPPTPPGAATVPPTQPKGLITIRIVKDIPTVYRVEFYCVTNRPLRWRLESSTDLLNWRLCEQYTGTNDFAPKVPMMRDNAQLVTWLLVKPEQVRAYYRLKPLP